MLKYALSHSDVSTCKSIVDIPPESCFGKYYNHLRFNVKATRLVKKVSKWFADGREKNKAWTINLQVRNLAYFVTTLSTVKNLRMDPDQRSHTFQLHVFAHIAVNLRDAVSLFSRVSVSNEQVLSLKRFCSNYYRATSLFLTSTLTTWTTGHIIPSHTKAIHQMLGLGLGINSMEGREGREAKHATLAKFTKKPGLVIGGLKCLNMSMCPFFG